MQRADTDQAGFDYNSETDSSGPAPQRDACADDGVDLRRLTLDAALRRGLCREPRIAVALTTVTAEEARRKAARGAYFPTVTGGAQRAIGMTSSTSLFGASKETNEGNSYSLQLSYLLLDFGGRAAQVRSAASLIHAARSTRDATVQTILSYLTIAYLDLMRHEQIGDIARSAVNVAQTAIALAKAQVDSGAAIASDIKSAEANYLQAKLLALRTEGQRKIARAELAALMGLPPNVDIVLARSSLFNSKADQLLKGRGSGDISRLLARVEAHPSVKAAVARAKSGEAQIEVARSALLPTLSVSVGHYLNGRPQSAPSARPSQETLVAFNISVPLFDGFSQYNRLQSVRAEHAGRLAELDQAKASVQLEVWKAIQAALQQVDVVDTSRALQESNNEIMRAAQVRYQNGGGDITEWLRAQRAYLDSRIELVRAQADLQAAKVSLLSSLGEFEMGSVVNVDAPVSAAKRKRALVAQ